MGGSFRNTQASAIIRCAASSHHSKGYTSFPAFGVPLSITLCFLRYPLFKKDRLSDPLADIALATSACVPLFNSALFAFFRGYSIPPGVSCSITSPFTFHRSLFTSPLPFAPLRLCVSFLTPIRVHSRLVIPLRRPSYPPATRLCTQVPPLSFRSG